MDLPPRVAQRARLQSALEWIRDFHRGRESDELVWIAMPPLVAAIQNWGLGRHAPHQLSAQRKRSLAQRRPEAVAVGWRLSGGHLSLTQTENHRRCIDPVVARFPAETAPALDRDPVLGDELATHALGLADELLRTAADASLELPLKPVAVYRTMLRAARALLAGEAMLAAVRPRTAVIGSPHGMRQRGLALVARRIGVPTAYIPHAPLIANLELADLPVDLAALRGPAEEARYLAAGARAEGIAVVGNPGIDDLPSVSVRTDAPVAFALPTDDEWALERLVELTHRALGDSVTASPHPRANRERLSELLPPAWAVWEGRTVDLLRSGPPALLQSSSGTGLEALAHGIPVVDLRFPGEPPNYPYLEDQRVATVSTAAELRSAVEAARSASGADREGLRSLARDWVAATGEAAARAAAETLDRLATQGPLQAPVWDAWGPARSAR